MYTPQVTKRPPLFGELREIRKPFSNSHIGKWNSQNLQRIAKSPLNLPAPVLNHTKFAPFALIFQDSLSPLAKLPTFATFMHLCIFADFTRFALIGKQPRLEQIQRNPP